MNNMKTDVSAFVVSNYRYNSHLVFYKKAYELNGYEVTKFENADPERGHGHPTFVGLQSYPGSRVAFRHLRWKALR